MRRLQLLTLALCAAALMIPASYASASHVAPVLPLTSGSNHSHEYLALTGFPAANLSNINLAFADLSNCTFAPGTDLSGANFTGANLTNTNLAGCIIDFALFRGANLTNATLPCAGLADFRGAILQGAVAPSGCAQCGLLGPNLKDQCTVGDLPGLCLVAAPFRGVVSGVVFGDNNGNGTLEWLEPGIANVSVTVNAGSGPITLTTDARGAYSYIATVAGPGTVTVNPATLPPGAVLTSSPSHTFDLNVCRSGQERNFSALDPATSAKKVTFGRIKSLYR